MAKSRAATAASKAKKASGTKAKAAASKKSPKIFLGGGGNLVTIEACKQWSAFKTRANKIVKYLAENGCDATVEINKTKPGRGNFVVRVEGKDEPVVELLWVLVFHTDII